MKSLYSYEIRRAVENLMAVKPYPELRYAIVEWADGLSVRVFEDNIKMFSESQWQIILEHVVAVKNTIESFGVSCGIEGVTGGGNTWTVKN